MEQTQIKTIKTQNETLNMIEFEKKIIFPHNESRVIRFNTVMTYKLP